MIFKIFKDDRERACTEEDIQEMTYLDCVIKVRNIHERHCMMLTSIYIIVKQESLRLLPSVGQISREAQEEFVYCK
jgi:competence transcription factor ComK